MLVAPGARVEQGLPVKRVLIPFLVAPLVAVASPVIDDHGLRMKLQAALAEVAERDDHVTGEDLATQAREARTGPLPRAAGPRNSRRMSYDEKVKGVVMVSSVYKCGKCDKWHLGGAASGWVLTSDGLMVTNHHVFEKADREAYGVMTLDGTFAEVAEIVRADAAADIAVFRVKGDGFHPLPLAEEVRVGEPAHVISHPDGRFFTYTAGRVSRLFQQHRHGQAATWMSITADYAKGSSGGPVFNNRGEVVGMVSSTSSLYYNGTAKQDPKERGPLQMVIKNCVSLPELRRVLGPDGAGEDPGNKQGG